MSRAVKIMSFTRDGADKRRKPRQIGYRQAIAERARDGKAEFRVFGCNAQIAAGRESGAASCASPCYDRNRRHAAVFERAHDAIHEGLVAERVVGRLKVLENGDVGARRERLLPAPVKINTLTESSAFTASQACASFSYISKVQALRASGRLMVIRAMPPFTSKRRSWAWLSIVITNSRQQKSHGDIAEKTP